MPRKTHPKRKKVRPKQQVKDTDRCFGCDVGRHHPGREVQGCNCSSCGSGTRTG